MKLVECIIMTESESFTDKLVKNLTEIYGLEVYVSRWYKSYHIKFKTDKRIYKKIKKLYDLETESIYLKQKY